MSTNELPPSLGGRDPRAGSAFARTRRRVGFTLLALSAVLTIWSLGRPDAGAPGGEPPAAPEAATSLACGPAAPAGATPLTLPREHADAWAPLVGAVVCFPDELIVIEVYELGRRGTLSLADRRLHAVGTGLEVDDDGLHVVRIRPDAWPADAWPLPWGLGLGAVRVGDAVHALAGTLERDDGGSYAVVPAAAPVFEARNPRPDGPPDVGGDIRVAAFNVFNYFVTMGSRGARDADELRRQTQKLVAAMVPLDADVLALIEVENDDGQALGALSSALDDALRASGSGRRYAAAASAPAGRGGDAIRQAFLYDPARLEVVAVHADASRIHLRPPQAVTLRPVAGGQPFTVIAVHHRARSSCPTAGDVDAGFGCWNLVRSAQTEALLRFAERVAEASASSDVLIVGDLNAHRFEPPITLFERHAGGAPAPWEVLTDRVPEDAYSYVFYGRSAALDHAIASASLAARVAGVAYWPINADEPPLADYRTRFNPAAAFRPDPFRSSDHDPLLVGLHLSRPEAPPRRRAPSRRRGPQGSVRCRERRQRARSSRRSSEASSSRRASQLSPSRQAVR